MLKRILATVLVLATVIGLLPVLPVSNMTAEAEEYTEGFYTYTVTDGEATITDVDTAISGDVTIPATLGGYPVTTIDYYPFDDGNSLTSITIPDSVTTIRDWVFNNCYSLTNINVDANNKVYSSVDGILFNKNLTELIKCPISYTGDYIIIPDSVTTIGDFAFSGCSFLDSINIPYGVTIIGDESFRDCESLAYIDIPDSVTSVGIYAFYNTAYYNDESNWDDNILYIDSVLIGGRTNVEDISIKVGTTVIASYAFGGNDSFSSITIPHTVKYICDGAFWYCDSLTDVYYIGTENRWKQVDIEGTNFAIENATMHFDKVASGTFGTLTWEVVADTEEIFLTIGGSGEIPAYDYDTDNWYFYPWETYLGYGDITASTVIIDEGVTAIGDHAFYWSGADTIILSNTVSSVGESAVKSCAEIIVDSENPYFCSEDGVLFNKDKTLLVQYPSYKTGDSYNIPATVKKIGALSFEGVELKTINIPASVEEIVTTRGFFAFVFCGNLCEINVASNNKNYLSENGVLFNKDKTVLYLYPAKKAGESYSIPETVKEIGTWAFYSSILAEITIPDGVTSIGEDAFYGCAELTSIEIPGSVKTISDSAFYLCKSLEEIVLEYGVETIGEYAFAWCEYADTTITIPSSVKKIGENADYIAYITDVYFMGSEEEWNAINIAGEFTFDDVTVHFHEHTYGSDDICTVCGYPNKITVSALSGISVTSNNAAYAVGTTAVKPNEVTLSITESSNGNTLVSALGANAKDSNKAYEISLKDSDGNKVTMTSGSITITLPFPAGVTSANYKDYDFALYHFTNGNKYEKVNATVNANGITFTASSFSPFLLTYEKKPAPTTTSTTTTTTAKPTTTTTTKATTTTTTTRPTTVTQTVTRIAGGSRTQTAVAISNKAFKTATTVILADGNGYADSLAGVPLAYALNAPILLVRNSKLDADTTAEITRLGAKKVIILGGELAISKDVVTTLQNMGITVERIAGKSRFDTAVEIAKKLENITGKKPTEVFFAFSHGYADALSIGGVAAAKKAPILYIAANGVLSDGTKTYLQSSGAKTATILGGKLAIAEAAEGNIKKAGASTVSRVYGQSRYATCIEINKKYASVLTGSAVCVATGMDYPDALAGGVFAAKNSAPLVLVPKTLTDVQTDYIESRDPANIYIFGGTIAVSSEIENQLKK